MIERAAFYERLGKCRLCPYWKGACSKGHALQSPVGCPIRKFEPMPGFAYHPDTPVELAAAPGPARRCCTEAADAAVVPLSYAQAAVGFAKSMAKAIEAGMPLVSDAVYGQRVGVCHGCGEFNHFQCRICKCLIWAKAKLATEDCPKRLWPKR